MIQMIKSCEDPENTVQKIEEQNNASEETVLTPTPTPTPSPEMTPYVRIQRGLSVQRSSSFCHGIKKW